MNEKELKSKLVKRMRKKLRGAVVFRHEDQWTSGIPDISVTFQGTTWIEVKYVKEDSELKMRGVQKLTCQNLEDNGDCWILIYEDHSIFGQRTHLIRPSVVDNWNGMVTTHSIWNGFNHDAVIKELFQ